MINGLEELTGGALSAQTWKNHWEVWVQRLWFREGTEIRFAILHRSIYINQVRMGGVALIAIF